MAHQIINDEFEWFFIINCKLFYKNLQETRINFCICQCCGCGTLIPDPGSVFRSRIHIKEFMYFNPKTIFLGLSEIWSGLFIPDLDPDFFTHPGFRVQKGTGSRIRIRNMGICIWYLAWCLDERWRARCWGRSGCRQWRAWSCPRGWRRVRGSILLPTPPSANS